VALLPDRWHRPSQAVEVIQHGDMDLKFSRSKCNGVHTTREKFDSPGVVGPSSGESEREKIRPPQRRAGRIGSFASFRHRPNLPSMGTLIRGRYKNEDAPRRPDGWAARIRKKNPLHARVAAALRPSIGKKTRATPGSRSVAVESRGWGNAQAFFRNGARRN